MSMSEEPRTAKSVIAHNLSVLSTDALTDLLHHTTIRPNGNDEPMQTLSLRFNRTTGQIDALSNKLPELELPEQTHIYLNFLVNSPLESQFELGPFAKDVPVHVQNLLYETVLQVNLGMVEMEQ